MLKNASDKNLHFTFEFSSFFKELMKFIKNNDLQKKVIIAIPRIVIEEIKRQKIEDFETSCQKLCENFEPFKTCNEFSLSVPNESFSYEAEISRLIDTYIGNVGIDIIPYPKNASLKSLIKKAVNKEKPFSVSKEHSDYGFKDAVIWESILNYRKIHKYDRVIFLSDDLVFDKSCEDEFFEHLNVYFNIFSSKLQLFQELSDLFSIPSEFQDIYAWAKEEYFRDFLTQGLSNKHYIRINNDTIKIMEYKIINPCEQVEKEFENNEETGMFIIISKVEIKTRKKKVICLAYTYIDDAKNLGYTEFNMELS